MNEILNPLGLKLGPTYLANLATKIESAPEFENIEWRGIINTKCNQIKYYGGYKFIEYFQQSFITSTSFGPPTIIAVDENGNDILLFDGCLHGYDNLFNHYNWTNEKINNRVLDQKLFPENQAYFDIIIGVFYDVNFDQEFGEDLNSEGKLEASNGNYITLDTLKRDGFCSFQIMIQEKGKKTYPIFESETC